jgi:hypothetical protein
MDIKDIDFSKCLLNPCDDKAVAKFIKEYPEFAKEHEGLNTRAVLTYIVLMYDRYSDMHELYADLTKKRKDAAFMAGFVLTKGRRFSAKVEDMLLGKVIDVNALIVKYVTLFYNPDYISYVCYWEMLYAETMRAMDSSATDSKELKETRTNITNLRKEINEIQKTLLIGDDTVALKKELYKYMEVQKLKLRPEDMAEMIHEKNVKFNNDVYYGSV